MRRGVVVMFKRILSATDASRYSLHALSTAVDLAARFDAEVLLVHVIDYPASYRGLHLDSQSYLISEDQIQKIGNYIMEKTLRELNTKDVIIKKIAAAGKTADTILELCKSSACDLIVLGTRGHSSVSGVLLGSVTQKILAKAPCPVLVVK